MYEPGAEAMAKVAATSLPAGIATVERRLLRPFEKPIRVYVCARMETFVSYLGREASGAVLNERLFLSPKQADNLGRIPDLLAHELAHLHTRQRQSFFMRLYRSATEAMVIREGLAVYGSDGGGADRVTIDEAWKALAEGRHIRSADLTGLDSDMLYRQSGLFIGFLAGLDAAKFRTFLFAIEDGQSSRKALQAAYGADLDSLWNRFVAEAKRR